MSKPVHFSIERFLYIVRMKVLIVMNLPQKDKDLMGFVLCPFSITLIQLSCFLKHQDVDKL